MSFPRKQQAFNMFKCCDYFCVIVFDMHHGSSWIIMDQGQKNGPPPFRDFSTACASVRHISPRWRHALSLLSATVGRKSAVCGIGTKHRQVLDQNHHRGPHMTEEDHGRSKRRYEIFVDFCGRRIAWRSFAICLSKVCK